MKNNVITYNLLTSFNPAISNINRKNNKITFKNLFILIKMFSNNELNARIFIKPILFKSFTILRAPYRYKLAKLNLSIRQYKITIKLTLKTKTNLNFYFYVYLIKKINVLFSTFMSNNHKTIVNCVITNNTNFLINFL